MKLIDLPKTPAYINASPSEKRKIFDSLAQKSKNYMGAPPEVQARMRAMVGLVDDMPQQGEQAQPKQQQYPLINRVYSPEQISGMNIPEMKNPGTYQNIRPMIAPIVETGGALLGGALAGSAAAPSILGAPAAAILGSSAGYAAGKSAMRGIDEFMGVEKPRSSLQMAKDLGKDAKDAATLGAGFSIAGKVAPAVAKTVGNLPWVKSGANWAKKLVMDTASPERVAGSILKQAVGTDATAFKDVLLKSRESGLLPSQVASEVNNPTLSNVLKKIEAQDPNYFTKARLFQIDKELGEITKGVQVGANRTENAIVETLKRADLNNKTTPMREEALKKLDDAAKLAKIRPMAEGNLSALDKALADKKELAIKVSKDIDKRDAARRAVRKLSSEGKVENNTAIIKTVEALKSGGVPDYAIPTQLMDKAKVAGKELSKLDRQSSIRNSLTEAMRSKEGSRAKLKEMNSAIDEYSKRRLGRDKGIIEKADEFNKAGIKAIDAQELSKKVQRAALSKDFAGDTQAKAVMKTVSQEIMSNSKNGVIGGTQLDAIKKNIVATAVGKASDKIAPDQQANITKIVGTKVNNLIKETIESKGGTGYKNYLSTHAAGERSIARDKLIGELAIELKESPANFAKVVNGNNPAYVERILGKKMISLEKELPKEKFAALQNSAKRIIMDEKRDKLAAGGLEEVKGIIADSIPSAHIPNVLNRTVMMVNTAAKKLEESVGKNTYKILVEAAKSPDKTISLLDRIPIEDKQKILYALKNDNVWKTVAKEGVKRTILDQMNSKPQREYPDEYYE